MSRLLDGQDQRTAVPSSGHRPLRPALSGRWTPGRIVAAVTAAVLVACAAWAVPAVREELRASYTRLPSTYTELYFTRTPTVEHRTATVPVSVIEHGSHASSYRLRVWLVTRAGRTTETTTVTLAPSRTDEPRNTTVRLPYGKRAAVVHVALLGRGQTLHYDLEGTS